LDNFRLTQYFHFFSVGLGDKGRKPVARPRYETLTERATTFLRRRVRTASLDTATTGLTEDEREHWTGAINAYLQNYHANMDTAFEDLNKWFNDNPHFSVAGIDRQINSLSTNPALQNLIRQLYIQRYGEGLDINTLHERARDFAFNFAMQVTSISQLSDVMADRSPADRRFDRYNQPIPGQETLGASLSGWAGFRLPLNEVQDFVRSLLPARAPPP
jgi:hypothetical protein